jgi:AraC-like DNA-binding protein
VTQYPELIPFICEGYIDFVFDEAQWAHVEALLRGLSLRHEQRRFGSVARMRGALLELIGFATECHAAKLQQLCESRVYLQARTDALGRVVKYLENNRSRPIGLTDAAEAAFLSPNYLSQLLKKQTGQAFVEWLTARRMQRARELLLHSNERVSMVARDVGFADRAYFTRRFSQVVGMSPSAYRKSSGGMGDEPAGGALAAPVAPPRPPWL